MRMHVYIRSCDYVIAPRMLQSRARDKSMAGNIPLLVLLLARVVIGDQVETSLNGDWTLSDSAGKVNAIKAQVPGTVHLDLMYAIKFRDKIISSELDILL